MWSTGQSEKKQYSQKMEFIFFYKFWSENVSMKGRKKAKSIIIKNQENKIKKHFPLSNKRCF